MRAFNKKIEHRKLGPNLFSHIYVSCAKLDAKGEIFWQDFDDFITELLPFIQLKNMATISHGLKLRIENHVPTSLDFITIFLKAFLKKQYVPYHD